MEPLLWLIMSVIFLIVAVWPIVRILHKAGYSGWWVLLTFIPVVAVIMIWIFSYARWPAMEDENT